MDAVLARLRVRFPVTVCAADVAHAKPDPEGYLLAAAKLGGRTRGAASHWRTRRTG